ncbi:MAG: hypothetical protein ABSH09_32145, partial [Bryobacteraceae bacterium]
MVIAGLEPQILVSGIVIAAAAAVALLVDYLKGKNEKLREALVELSVRRERERSSAPPATEPAPTAAPILMTSKIAEPSSSRAEQPKLVELAPEPVATQIVSTRSPLTGGRRRNPNPVPPPESLPRLDDMNPREALSEWLNKRAAARTERPEPTPIQATQLVPVPPAAPPPLVPNEPARPAVYIDEFLWESIMTHSIANKQTRVTGERSAEERPQPPPPVRFEVIQRAFPAGMQDQSALDRLLQTNKPFTGLVIALGVNQNDGRAASRDEILSVNAFVRSLLRPEDFACRTANDDFLILCPGEKGVEAKQRLNQISERLWDFQL